MTLENSVPVLSNISHERCFSLDARSGRKQQRLTMVVVLSMVSLVRKLCTLIRKLSPYNPQSMSTGGITRGPIRTLFPLMIGPGKVPPARTAWRRKPSGLITELMTARSVTGPMTELCAEVVVNTPRAARKSERERKAILVWVYVTIQSLSLGMTAVLPNLLYQPT